MIDHIILTVSDVERSVAFYAKALKPLGITNFTDYEGQDGHPDLKGFGDGKRAFFWLKEGKPDPQAVHVGFVAKDHAEVDAFFKAAVDAGGKSKEAPQARPEYYPGYYATWVLDPDGHDIEVVHKSEIDFHCANAEWPFPLAAACIVSTYGHEAAAARRCSPRS
jgi:catechol 2,3-dioxygenase-like lactoylglutathione lyase family enzyme